MATKITVVGKVITIPKTPYLVQTDNAVEHFQFDIDESSVVLADKSFYLLFKTSRNSASMQPLPDVSVDPVTGHVLIDWVPDSEFTAVNGYTDIQLKAMSGQTLIWNTTKATVYVYNELLNTAAAQVNPKTPTLFLYYLHVMEGIKEEVVKIYDTFMNNPTIEVDPNVGTPSAEITVEGTGEAKHYHFSFHNLKGETGDGEVNDVMTSKDGTTYTTVVDPVDKKARISFKDIKHVYHQATEPTDAEVGDVWTTDEEGGGGGTWGTITGDIQDQTDLQTEFASKQNKIYHQNTEPATAVEGDVWTSDEEGGGAVADVEMSRDGVTYHSVVDASGNAKVNLEGHSKVYHQDPEPTDAIAGDLWMNAVEGGTLIGENGVVVNGDSVVKLDPTFIKAGGGKFTITGQDIVLEKGTNTYKLSEIAKKTVVDKHIANQDVHLTNLERKKLTTIEVGAQKNVQTDLTETDDESAAFFKGREAIVDHLIDSFRHLNVTDRTKLDAMISALNFSYDPITGIISLTV